MNKIRIIFFRYLEVSVLIKTDAFMNFVDGKETEVYLNICPICKLLINVLSFVSLLIYFRIDQHMKKLTMNSAYPFKKKQFNKAGIRT